MTTPSKELKYLTGELSKLKATDNYISANSEDRSKQYNTVLAMLLAYQCAPIPSDTDIIVAQYYHTYIYPQWSTYLSEINENVDVIDMEKIEQLAKRIYLARYDTAHGRKSMSEIIDSIICNNALSGQDRECLGYVSDTFK